MANTSHRDVEIQSPTTLKSEEYRQLFRLPPEEFLVQDFNCAFQDSILFQYFFTSFISRDEAYKLFNDGWVQHGNGGNEITEQQELMLESCSKENGFVAIEKVNSFKTLINDMESRDGGEDVSTTNNFKVPSTSENDTEVGPESIINTNSSTPTDTCFLVPENCDAPKVPDYFIKVAETKFPIKVEEFFNLYFSDNAINFIKSFHRRRGDKGAKFCSCKESQKFQIYRNSHWVLETSQEVNDVPYGDYFRVEGFWNVERDSDGPVEGCISRVYVNVAFNKKTVWKGKIVKSTREECQEAYATWQVNC